MNGNNCTCNDVSLHKKLMMYRFALVDAGLFLDTHPDCDDAIRYLSKTKALYEEAKKEYIENIGPLTFTDTIENGSFNWTDSPWPWHNGKECIK